MISWPSRASSALQRRPLHETVGLTSSAQLSSRLSIESPTLVPGFTNTSCAQSMDLSAIPKFAWSFLDLERGNGSGEIFSCVKTSYDVWPAATYQLTPAECKLQQLPRQARAKQGRAFARLFKQNSFCTFAPCLLVWPGLSAGTTRNIPALRAVPKTIMFSGRRDILRCSMASPYDNPEGLRCKRSGISPTSSISTKESRLVWCMVRSVTVTTGRFTSVFQVDEASIVCPYLLVTT